MAHFKLFIFIFLLCGYSQAYPIDSDISEESTTASSLIFEQLTTIEPILNLPTTVDFTNDQSNSSLSNTLSETLTSASTDSDQQFEKHQLPAETPNNESVLTTQVPAELKLENENENDSALKETVPISILPTSDIPSTFSSTTDSNIQFSTVCTTEKESSEVKTMFQPEIAENTTDDSVAQTLTNVPELPEESKNELKDGESLLSQRSTDGQDATDGQVEAGTSESTLLTIETTTVAYEELNISPTETLVNLPVTASIETEHESLIATDSNVIVENSEIASSNIETIFEPTNATPTQEENEFIVSESQQSTEGQDATEAELDKDHSKSAALTMDATTVASKKELNFLTTETSADLSVTEHESLIETDSNALEIEDSAVETPTTEPSSAKKTTSASQSTFSPILASEPSLPDKEQPKNGINSLPTSFGSNSTHRLSSASILKARSSAMEKNVSFLLALLALMANYFVIKI